MTLRHLTVLTVITVLVLGPVATIGGVPAEEPPDTGSTRVGAVTAAGSIGGVAEPTPEAVPSGPTDVTPNRTMARSRLGIRIADLRFSTAGNVSEVIVNPGRGADAANITTNDIRTVTVLLYNNSGVPLVFNTVDYTSLSQPVTFGGNVSNVGGIIVIPGVDADAEEGDVIDALVTVKDGSGNSITIDTNGTQRIVRQDFTAVTNTSRGLTAEIAELRFDNPEKVATVNVDARGIDATNITSGDIDAVTVTLYGSDGGVLARRTATYNRSTTVNLSSGNVTGVTRVRVLANVSEAAEFGDVIDAVLGIRDAASNAKRYDTLGNQSVADATNQRVRGTVDDSDGNPVGNASVRIIDLKTDAAVVVVTTRSDGTFGPLALPPNRYTAEVRRPLFTSFATRIDLDEGESERISVVLTPIEYADRITVTPANAPLTGGNATFVVTVFDQMGDPLSGVTVRVNLTADSDPSVTVLNNTVTTNGTGQATVTVTGNDTALATLRFEAINVTGGPNATATATTGRLGDVNGDGYINTGDVIQVQRSIVGLSTGPSFSAQAADVTGDGTIDTGDVIQIQRAIVGLSSALG